MFYILIVAAEGVALELCSLATEGTQEPSTASNIGNYYLFFFRLVSDIPVGINIYNEPGVIIPLPCKFRQ